MCGIVGVLEHGGAVDPGLLTAARDRLRRRGPDDAGTWIAPDGRVGLGHRRLSILDLSPAGRQPMLSDDGRLAITFNGEVYNFREIRKELQGLGDRFRSESDTEVILAAYRRWGKACLSRFVGMFAFAIWDGAERTLFLARDRMGVKPLYYHPGPARFLFGSRPRALLAFPDCPRDLDEEALGLYLDAGYVPAPWSMIRGMRKLRPGHWLEVRDGKVVEERWWNPDGVAIDPSLEAAPEEELVERLDGLLRDAVRLRLVSDVPLGAFLSGGIDSSLVVALMREAGGRPPRTFTIGFQEAAYDEAPHARAVAAHLGTEHHERTMGSKDLLALLDLHGEEYDEPFGDQSSLPTMLVSRFAREQVTVSLSGDGGDELFAGYPYYGYAERLSPAFRFPRLLRRAGGAVLGLFGRSGRLLAHALAQPSRAAAYGFMRTVMKHADRDGLVRAGLPRFSGLCHERAAGFPREDAVAEGARLDLAYYLPDDLLQKVDVASMAFSLEAREPLLDHRLIEFALRLPTRFKREGGRTKRLLRRVLSRYVPERLFERPKQGFGVPIREWFRGELKDLVRDALSPSRLKAFGHLDPDGVRRVIDLHLTGRRDVHSILWVLLNLMTWDERVRRAP